MASAAARAFRSLGVAPSSDPHIPPLTVVTYNLLADKYATSGYHAYCPPHFLDLAYRGPRLIAELLGYGADVLCLQEVERPFLEHELEPALQRAGYEHTSQALFYGRRRKPTDAVPGPEEGVCLAYKTARLERLASRVVRFADVAPTLLSGASSHAGPSGSKFWSFVSQREDGACFALLRDRQANRVLLASSTHLFWDPKWPDVKAVQAASLCHAARDFLRQHGAASARWAGQGPDSLPVVLAGDFNSLPLKTQSDAFDHVPEGRPLVSGTYELLSSGALDSRHHDHPAARRTDEPAALRSLQLHTAGLRLGSAMADGCGAEPDCTTRTESFAGCLDYIFYSPQHFEVAAALEMPYEGETCSGGDGREARSAAPPTPLPNARWPSDHVAVGVQLQWRPTGDSSL